MNDDFRHIKIHIFAMPSRNEIKRSLHKTKHVFGKIKRQKRSSGTKKGTGCSHSSTGHNPFELMFGREMRIPLDVMVGVAEDNDCSYTDFVTVELHKLHST